MEEKISEMDGGHIIQNAAKRMRWQEIQTRVWESWRIKWKCNIHLTRASEGKIERTGAEAISWANSYKFAEIMRHWSPDLRNPTHPKQDE